MSIYFTQAVNSHADISCDPLKLHTLKFQELFVVHVECISMFRNNDDDDDDNNNNNNSSEFI
jgi:hypothetical protein